MARDVAAAYPEAKAVFDEAARRLGFDLARVCFEGPEDLLNTTRMSQPGILATSLAILAVLKERKGFPEPQATAGLSLGEYTALTVAGAMEPGDALELVHLRGMLMEECCRKHPGGMVTFLGMDEAQVNEICREASAAGAVRAANLNSPGQIVISGEAKALEAATALAKQRGLKRAIPLKVEGAFHSPLMVEAGEGLAKRLRDVRITAPKCLVVTNVTGEPVRTPEEIRDALTRQVSSAVRWEACMRRLIAEGFRTFYEIGPGKVLAGLAKRIDPAVEVISIGDCASLEALP